MYYLSQKCAGGYLSNNYCEVCGSPNRHKKNIVNLCLHVCCLSHQAGSVNVGAEGGHLLVILLQIVHCPLSFLTVIQIPYVDKNIFTGSLLSK